MLTVTNGGETDWANIPLDDLAFGNAMDCDFTLRSYNILKSNGRTIKRDYLSDASIKGYEAKGWKVEEA